LRNACLWAAQVNAGVLEFSFVAFKASANGELQKDCGCMTKSFTEMMVPTVVRAKEARVVDDSRPTVADLQGNNYFATFAQTHWLKGCGECQLKPEQLKTELWDVLEKEDFAFKSLLILENLQTLEKCICSATVLVIVLMVN
jgi:hypothetical protein